MYSEGGKGNRDGEKWNELWMKFLIKREEKGFQVDSLIWEQNPRRGNLIISSRKLNGSWGYKSMA